MPRPSDIARLHFLFFHAHGISVPYLPVALERSGFSGGAIGALLAVMLAGSPLVLGQLRPIWQLRPAARFTRTSRSLVVRGASPTFPEARIV